MKVDKAGRPLKQGLYDPAHEKDSCGVGFVVDIQGRKSHQILRQVFIGRNPEITDDPAFERKLYVIRKRAYTEIRDSTLAGAESWYVCSLSCRTLVYKGMLTTMQLDQYFPDLKHPGMETALALV